MNFSTNLSISSIANFLTNQFKENSDEKIMAMTILLAKNLIEEYRPSNEEGMDVFLALKCLQKEDIDIFTEGSLILWLNRKGFGSYTVRQLLEKINIK